MRNFGGPDYVPSFRLTWKNVSTRDIRFDVSGENIATMLEQDIVNIGKVKATRSANENAKKEGCLQGAYVWSITFASLEGDVPQMDIDDAHMHNPRGIEIH